VNIVLRLIIAILFGRRFGRRSDGTRIAQAASDRFSTSRYGRTGGELHHGSGISGM
jgi:hypothetical protein